MKTKLTMLLLVITLATLAQNSKSAVSSGGQMVDWDKLDLEFKERGLY